MPMTQYRLKPGWLADDLREAGRRAEEMKRDFWRGRINAAKNGRCPHCGKEI